MLFFFTLAALFAQASSFKASAAKTNAPVPKEGRLRKTSFIEDVISPASEEFRRIIHWERARRWWGFPSYATEHEHGMRTWDELAEAHGKIGLVCEQHNQLEICGQQYVCKQSGVCDKCSMSRECGDKFACDSWSHTCIPRDLASQWHWPEVVATGLIVITAMLSAAAGMGGGGVYVPLLLLFLGLSAQEAVPLSQAMIVGGATVNLMVFTGERNPAHPSRPRIDYDIVMMLNPGLAAGVTVGVMCNLISPQWLITAVLLVTLAITLQKSMNKGLSEWKKESEAREKQKLNTADVKFTVKLGDMRTFVELAQTNLRPILLILGCWLCFLVISIFKGPQCSTLYWLQLAALLVICGAFTLAGAKTVIENGALSDSVPEGMLKWTPTTIWMYPLMSATAGFLGGFLGIGGGIIMGPMLLELGMSAQVSQATTAMFVFLSSSLATIQFVLLDKAMVDHTIWFTSWVLAATLIGQVFIDYFLKKYQRTSLIVLSIAAIVGASMVMMTCIGLRDVIADIRREAPMGFSTFRLCHP
mmetsp:Transcript_81437/g.143809  ORF Transcript_81437/g.143809 Transcript_81437/m.143809 type:complete len:530 (-) Transcript_81437:115-1704(-)